MEETSGAGPSRRRKRQREEEETTAPESQDADHSTSLVMTILDREEHTGIGSEEENSSKCTVMENLEKELADIETEDEKELAEIETEEEFPNEFQCCVCMDLLYKPVILGCGHLSCFWCVFNAMDNAMDNWLESHCPLCRDPYNHFPSICRLMHFLLVKLYPIAYKRRKRQVLGLVRAQQEAAIHESLPRNIYSSWWSGQGPKVHYGVGCDYCGMFPIIGERYKCIDCLEKIGFDLCEGCYNSSSKLPGRFNQQHKPNHKFVVRQVNFGGVLIWSGPEHSEEDGSNDSGDQEDDSPALTLEMMFREYFDSSDDAPWDLEGAAPHIPSSNTLEEDQEGAGYTSMEDSYSGPRG